MVARKEVRRVHVRTARERLRAARNSNARRWYFVRWPVFNMGGEF
jgi:hypothetical protein